MRTVYSVRYIENNESKQSAFFFNNKEAAQEWANTYPMGFVVENPVCSSVEEVQGKTHNLINFLKSGEKVLFQSVIEAERFKKLCAENGKNIHAMILDSKTKLYIEV